MLQERLMQMENETTISDNSKSCDIERNSLLMVCVEQSRINMYATSYHL